jgi:hypothetical protein
MRRALAIAAALALGSGLAAAAPPVAKLSVGDVRTLVAAMEAATKAGDPEKAASFMADDCAITTSFPRKDGSKKITTKSKAKFVEDDTAARARSGKHDYAATVPTIDIDDAHTVAKASYKVADRYVEDGKVVTLVAYQIATVELRAGEPKVTAMDVDAVQMSIDDRQIF